MTMPDPRRPTSPDALRAFHGAIGHRPPARTAPLRIDAVQAPATLVPLDAGFDGRRGPATGFGAAGAWLSRLRDRLGRSPRSGRCPDAACLTDRQLADIGLARPHAEGRPGGRGRAPAGWSALSPWGGP